MPLSSEQGQWVTGFREWLESAADHQLRLADRIRIDREDRSTLAARWCIADRTWSEVVIRPFLPQVSVAIVTDDRQKNSTFKQMIEDSGDTLQEFVELSFDAVGLKWPEPPVQHYRDRDDLFYFATPLDLKSLGQLSQPATRRQVFQMLTGYCRAFAGFVAG